MSELTWPHISNWLMRGEKELDRQVIQAALVKDIRGRAAIGLDLSMIDSIIFNGNIAYSGEA